MPNVDTVNYIGCTTEA